MFKRSAMMMVDLRFTGYALSMGFAMGAIFAYVAGSPDVFIGVFGIGAFAYSLIFASNSIGLYCGGLLNRLLLRRVGPHQILRIASIIAVMLGLLLLIAATTGIGGAPVFIGLTFLCISVMGLIFPNAVAAAMAPFSKNAGAASSMLGLTQYAVGALSGAVVGAFHTGTAVPMAAVLAACQVSVCVSIMFAERVRQRARANDYAMDSLPMTRAA
jgi:DHA1 family bicyclomycin/chloramphenicol resistance-like MFS transporter